MRPLAFQVDEPIYRPQHVARDARRELVEQRPLVDLPLPNHGFTPGFDARVNQRFHQVRYVRESFESIRLTG
jgi:hypothetical protein